MLLPSNRHVASVSTVPDAFAGRRPRARRFTRDLTGDDAPNGRAFALVFPNVSHTLRRLIMNLYRFFSLTITVGSLLSTAAPAAEPARAVDPAMVWDLTLLYPNEAAWRAAKEQVATGIPKVKTYEGRLGESAATLREAMVNLYGVRWEFWN